MNNYYWKMFEKSGKIHDYLHYACASEEGVSKKQHHAARMQNKHSSSKFMPPAAACREDSMRI